MRIYYTSLLAALAIALSALSSSTLIAQDDPVGDPAVEDQPAETVSETTTVTETSGYEKPLPLSLDLDYTLVSDYIFRGFNFSEHRTEGRESPNHQLGVSVGLDLAPLWGGEPGECGELSFDAWFEWYADQEKISGDGANIQEIDYTISYTYHVEPIATDVTIGWIDYVFPNWDGPGDRTHEWFLSFAHNDAWAWRWTGYDGDDGILNPTFDFYHDMEAFGGTWMDLGISHGFEFVEDLTFTPSYTLHIDGGWAGPAAGLVDDHDTRIAGMTYGMDLTYDLTQLLQMPEQAGSMSLSGFLNWFDPTQRLRSTLGWEDHLYGGVKLAWSW